MAIPSFDFACWVQVVWSFAIGVQVVSGDIPGRGLYSCSIVSQ